MNFFQEVWTGFRPYLVSITQDFLISASLWVFLFIFKLLTYLLPIPGWAGEFIVHVHSAGTLAAVGIFAWMSVIDIIRLKGGGGVECFA